MIKYESPQYLYFHIESYVFFISPSVSTHIIIGDVKTRRWSWFQEWATLGSNRWLRRV